MKYRLTVNINAKMPPVDGRKCAGIIDGVSENEYKERFEKHGMARQI